MQTEANAVTAPAAVTPTTGTPPEPAQQTAETSTATGTEQPAAASTEQPQQDKPKNDWV